MAPFKEMKAGARLKVGPGKTMTLVKSMILSEAYQVVQMFPQEQNTQYLIEFVLQQIGLDAGVSPASQGDISSLPQMNTATGVKQVLAHGNVLSRRPINEMARGIAALAAKAARQIFWRMDADEAFEFLEGGRAMLRVFNPRALREKGYQFAMNIRLRMTRFREEEALAEFLKLLEVIKEYLALEPEIQIRMRPFFVDELKKLGLSNADDVLPVVAAPAPDAAAPEAAGAEEGPADFGNADKLDATLDEYARDELGSAKGPSIGGGVLAA